MGASVKLFRGGRCHKLDSGLSQVYNAINLPLTPINVRIYDEKNGWPGFGICHPH